MTLQQKLLAKQSKKGFTLVELVVVIAILAILAAIAIPAVVGIIDNAQKSAKSANASSLDSAIKKLNTAVQTGGINNESKEIGGLATSKLPAKTATTAARKSFAKALTIDDAIAYDGLTSSFAGQVCGDYAYSNDDGTIIYVGSDSYKSDKYTTLEAKGGTFSALTLGEFFIKTT